MKFVSLILMALIFLFGASSVSATLSPGLDKVEEGVVTAITPVTPNTGFVRVTINGNGSGYSILTNTDRFTTGTAVNVITARTNMFWLSESPQREVEVVKTEE
jgi:hypothetical protein